MGFCLRFNVFLVSSVQVPCINYCQSDSVPSLGSEVELVQCREHIHFCSLSKPKEQVSLGEGEILSPMMIRDEPPSWTLARVDIINAVGGNA